MGPGARQPHAARGWLVLPALAAISGCGLFDPAVYVAPDAGQPGIAPVPVQIRFEGAGSIAEFRLRRSIEDRLYDQSCAPDSEVVAVDAAFDLEDRYRRDGFADVVVTAARERWIDEQGDVGIRLTFTIDEGPQWTVAELRLPGLDQLDDDVREKDVLALWLRRASGTLGFGDPLWVETDLLGFVDSLRVFLRGRGYLDATVAAPQTIRDPERNSVTVTVAIDAGERYRIRSASLGPRATAALATVTPPAPPTGEVAEIRRVEQYRYAVLAALRDRGHVEAAVTTELSRDPYGSPFLDVVVEADPGPRGRIDAVVIDGIERTDEQVVIDRLGFAVGDDYVGSRVDESLRELYLTGLFRRVEIEHRWLETPPRSGQLGDPESREQETRAREIGAATPLELQVDVEEERSRAVEFMAGYGSYERARGKVRFEEANLFGTGRNLTAEGRLSTRGERANVTVTDPRVLGYDTTLAISGDAYRREEPGFEDRAWGGTIALSREVIERLTARVGYTARLHTGTSTDVATAAASIDEYTEGSLFAEARLDERDAIVYPSRGWQVYAKFDTNQPWLGATVEFLRARFGASAFLPLSDRTVLAFRAEHGSLWPGDGSDRIPLPERFYNGGENSVRSFRESQLGPLDAFGQPTGGEYRNLFGTELRTRVTRSVETALFFDAGNLGSDVRDVTLDGLRPALGLGLRWTLPIGPVRVDGAWNPDREPGEREWTVHVSVGYPF